MKTIAVYFLLGLALLSAASAQAKTFGIVVGINEYQPAAKLRTLRGAENDARLVAETLRGQGVDLPDSRVLTGSQATLENFKATWRKLTGQAQAGDQIIFTFAGHGWQEKEFAKPFDEDDGLDETFMFYDFDAQNPHLGRLSDDELYDLFKQAAKFKIVFVADSCHSGESFRDLDDGLPERGDGPTGGYQPPPPSHDWNSPATDDREILSHVTYLLATKQAEEKVREIDLGGQGQYHGALSVAFAEAFGGGAGYTRSELEAFVRQRVAALTRDRQQPDMVPRGGGEPAFAEGGQPKPPAAADLPIKVTGGQAPAGLEHARLADAGYRLRFDIRPGKAEVFNPQNEKLGEVDAGAASEWNALVAKYRLLAALDARPAAGRVEIKLAEGKGPHRQGERLHFSFAAKAGQRHLLLFDLAGTGRLQFLYPLKKLKDPEKVAEIPYAQELEVVPPGGEDTIVAVFCENPQPKAVELLDSYDQRNPPTPEDLLGRFSQDCRFGRLGYFSGS